MSALPPSNSGWYFAWIDFHRKATAANADAVAALIANEEVAMGTWEATRDELFDATKRLIASHRTPKFANEHVDAVGMEIVKIRAERRRAGYIAMQPTGPNNCSERCNRGLHTAPLPQLVRDGKTGRDLARQTCIVICDVCDCGKAEIAAQDRVEQCAAPEERWKKKKLMTLTAYLDRTGGLDGIAMLREYEATATAIIRKSRSTDTLASLPAMAAALGASMRVPYKERPRGPESLDDF